LETFSGNWPLLNTGMKLGNENVGEQTSSPLVFRFDLSMVNSAYKVTKIDACIRSYVTKVTIGKNL
jgi:hypothetical protein